MTKHPEIRTEITIQATPEKVWQVLTNFQEYAQWNPFIKSITGPQQEGKNIEVFIQPPGGKGMTFKPEVLRFERNKEFRWLGKLFFKGLFDGEHYFILESDGQHGTCFIHGEKFKGILAKAFKNVIAKATHGFELMNQALKKESEAIRV